jgi:hypothetical protein
MSTPMWPRACKRCARGLRLACLTSKPGEFARKGPDGHFNVVVGGDAFKRKKSERVIDRLDEPV